MLLSEFAGNKEVISELTDCMNNSSLPHGIIIEGAPGTGKKTLAGIIASYGVCSSGKYPCGQCAGCVKSAKGIHPDIFVADGTTLKNISVDAIRWIRSDAYIKPNEAQNKVYILADCDNMQAPAQNAFLKILEDPPAHVIFIMTTASSSSLLETVRSRSRIFSLIPPSVQEAVGYTSVFFPDIPLEKLTDIASSCDGNIGMMISAAKGETEQAMKLAEDIMKAVPKSSEYELLKLTNLMCSDRSFAVKVADCLIEIAAESVKASAGIETTFEVSKRCSEIISKKRLDHIYKKIVNGREVLNTNVNLNFFGTWFCASLRE